MKKPFDTIVGPEGVWTDDAEVVGENGLTAREDFALGCLNAAVNCTDENSGSITAHFAEMRPRDAPCVL